MKSDRLLAKLDGNACELIITDNATPAMNGSELCNKLKAKSATARLPVLMISASSRSEIPIEAQYDAFLRKPFLAEDLLKEVRKLLASPSAIQNHYLKA